MTSQRREGWEQADAKGFVGIRTGVYACEIRLQSYTCVCGAECERTGQQFVDDKRPRSRMLSLLVW